MPEAVIVDAVRSPIGRAFKGSLLGIRPDDLGAYVVDALLDRNPEVDPASVDDIIVGCGLTQGEQGYNIGRAISMLSRLPVQVTSAVELDESTVRHIGERIEQQTGRKVELSSSVEPDILGGIVVRVGNSVLDASIRNRLENFRKQVARAS